MILRCDGHFSRSQIFDWLITAAMPKFQFEGPPAKGKTEHLMTKANSEDRFATHQIADRFVGIRQRFRITRAVRQKNAIRIEREHLFGCGCGRENGDTESALPERSQNVAFHSIIEGNNTTTDWRKDLITVLQRPFLAQLIIRIPLKNIRRGYFAHVIHPDDAFAIDGALDGFFTRSNLSGEAGFHRATRSEMPGARVYRCLARQEFPSAADNHLTILRLASCSGFRLALR